jgi:hypothetical protein
MMKKVEIEKKKNKNMILNEEHGTSNNSENKIKKMKINMVTFIHKL